MTIITTTNLRENMADIFEAVQAGQEIVVRFGRGKNAKLVCLSLLDTATQSKKLPKSHSLLKFTESDFYKRLPINSYFADAVDLKQIYKENFLSEKFKV